MFLLQNNSYSSKTGRVPATPCVTITKAIAVTVIQQQYFLCVTKD